MKLPPWIALAAIGAASAAADEWNQWRGVGRDGVAENSPRLISSLPETGLEPVWQSGEVPSARDGGWASPVIADGYVYIFAHTREQVRELGKMQFPYLPPEKRVGMTDEEYAQYEENRREEIRQRGEAFAYREVVHCYDLETGEEPWTNRSESVYTRFPQSGSPAVVDGRLYFLGAGRHVRCLDAATGHDVWTTRLPGEFTDEFMNSSVLVHDDRLVVMADHLFCLSTDGGDILWEGDSQQTKGAHSSPVVWTSPDGNDFIIANVQGKKTACVSIDDGSVLWSEQTFGGQATPVVVGDRLITYGNSREKGLRCFVLAEAGLEPVWEAHRLQDKGSTPVVLDGSVFVQGERRLACFDFETGAQDWMTMIDVAKPQFTSLVAADDKVFYGLDGLLCFRADSSAYQPLYFARFDSDGLMADEEVLKRKHGISKLESSAETLEQALRAYDREITRSGPLVCATPAIANGRIVIRFNKHLACYDLRVQRP